MEDLKKEVVRYFITSKNKINPWVGRDSWLKKKGLQELVSNIHETIPDKDLRLRDKIMILWRHGGVRPKCKNCGKGSKPKNGAGNGFYDYCSISCAGHSRENKSKRRANSLRRYGVEHPSMSREARDKFKKTCLERYGHEHHSRSKEVREKTRQTNLNVYNTETPSQNNLVLEKISRTNLERYGVKSPLLSLEVQEKIRRTNLEKYGVVNPFLSPSIKEKIRRTNLEKYGVDNVWKSYFNHTSEQISYLTNTDLIIEEYTSREIAVGTLAKEIGIHPSTFHQKLSRKGHKIKRFKYSYPETMIHEILDEAGIEYQKNTRGLFPNNKRLEIDVYIPSHDLGIEVNGLFWHSFERNKDKRHLLKKTESFPGKLLHFYDVEVENKKEIVRSIVLGRLKVYDRILSARNCKVVNLTSRDYRKFCDENHIQGSRNASIRIGLTYDGELVSLMSFSKTGEMVRFCTKLNTRIRGGASRLLKNCESRVTTEEIYTFADRRLFVGDLYEKIGFSFVRTSPPNYWYFSQDDYRLRSRVQFQKHKLSSMLEDFDPALSEYENTRRNGWFRIFDCGSYKYKKKVMRYDKS